MTGPIHYQQPAQTRKKTSLGVSFWSWVLFGGFVGVLWVQMERARPAGSRSATPWLLVALGLFAALIVAYVGAIRWWTHRHRWTVERYYRVRKLGVETTSTFDPMGPEEAVLAPAVVATQREFALLGFAQSFTRRSSISTASWIRVVGGSLYLLSVDGRTLAQVTYIKLTSRAFRLIAFKEPAVVSRVTLISVAADGRWMRTVTDAAAEVNRPHPPWVDTAIFPGLGLKDLIAAHESRTGDMELRSFSIVEDVKRAVEEYHGRAATFHRSIGYVRPEEVWPRLEKMTPKRRAAELRSLKALRAADGHETIIPVE